MTRSQAVARSIRLVTIILILVVSVSPVSAFDVVEPEEDLTTAMFRSGDTGLPFQRLDQTAHYLFCGRGELEIQSRAVLGDGENVARYVLLAAIDGETPARELDHRSQAFTGASFDNRHRATALRKATFELGRGCHTVALSVGRSTVDTIAVRVVWDRRAPVKRPWEDITLVGGRRAELSVGDSRSDYRRVERGRKLELDVEGPAWVRLLARPTGPSGNVDYRFTVRANDDLHRHYRLRTRPSRQAWLVDEPDTRVSRSNEIVFPVPAGRHTLVFATNLDADLLLRSQIAQPGDAGIPTAIDTGWAVRGRVASYYDDNILRYSDKFIQRFEDGRDPSRFRVESLDDFIQRLDLYVDHAFPGLRKREAKIGVDIEHRAYLRNDIKDWTRFGVHLDQDLGLGRSATITASYSPGFYVRHIRDSDLTGASANGTDPFQAFEFDKTEFRAEYRHPLGASLDARYHAGLAIFEHSDAFTEFDSDNLFIGARLDHRLSRELRLSYAVEYTDSSAQGYDQPGETLETSDDTDPSYRQFDLMLAARYRFPGPRRHTLFLQAEYGQREYTTDKPANLAPLHNGREDQILRYYASWQLRLTPRYSLTLFAQARDRSSDAPIDLDIGVEKDYEQFEIGLRVTARFGR
ncbi:MAG: hypothetical protein AAGD38_20520 [Acidobacteriota bacterium]